MKNSELLEVAIAQGKTSYKVMAPVKLGQKLFKRKSYEIDDAWVTGIRKWWKQIYKKSKTYKGRPDSKKTDVTYEDIKKAIEASFVYLNEVRTAMLAFREDFMYIKGFGDIIGFEIGDKSKKYIDEIFSTLMSMQAVLSYQSGDCDPNGSMIGNCVKDIEKDPKNAQFYYREISLNVDDYMKKVDSLFSGKLLRFLNKIVKTYGDQIKRVSAEPGKYVEDVVKIGKVSLVFKDGPEVKDTTWMPFKGGQSRHDTHLPTKDVGEGLRKKERMDLVDEMRKAQALLRQKKVGFLWYGDIIKYPPLTDKIIYGNQRGKDFLAAAVYYRGGDAVRIYHNRTDAEIVIHELGHRYWYKFLSNEDRHNFSRFFGKVKAPSTYGGTSAVEEFAELFSAYVSGKWGRYRKLDRDQRNRFVQFVTRKRRLEDKNLSKINDLLLDSISKITQKEIEEIVID